MLLKYLSKVEKIMLFSNEKNLLQSKFILAFTIGYAAQGITLKMWGLCTQYHLFIGLLYF